MDWASIISAILAGGLAGQITTLFLNARIQERREFRAWKREEKYKVYSKIVTSASAYHSRTDFDTWPDEIRELSVQIHFLNKSGTASEDISQVLQEVFHHVLDKKLGKIKDDRLREWRRSLRGSVRKLRILLAEDLHRGN
jgi:hypothetical protein